MSDSLAAAVVAVSGCERSFRPSTDDLAFDARRPWLAPLRGGLKAVQIRCPADLSLPVWALHLRRVARKTNPGGYLPEAGKKRRFGGRMLSFECGSHREEPKRNWCNEISCINQFRNCFSGAVTIFLGGSRVVRNGACNYFS